MIQIVRVSEALDELQSGLVNDAGFDSRWLPAKLPLVRVRSVSSHRNTLPWELLGPVTRPWRKTRIWQRINVLLYCNRSVAFPCALVG